MNAFFTSSIVSDDPNDPLRLEAKSLLGEITEVKVLNYHFFIKKGFEHEQEQRIKLLREQEKRISCHQ